MHGEDFGLCDSLPPLYVGNITITRNLLPPAQLPLPRGLEPLVASAVPWQPPAQGIGPFAASVLPVELPDQDSSAATAGSAYSRG